MKNLQYNSYEVGDKIPELKFGPIKHTDLVRYSGASGDFNPIHIDSHYAKNVGLGNTIAHGMYIAGQMTRLCTQWINPKNIINYSVKFRNMVHLKENIICTGKIKKKVEKENKRYIIVSIEAKNEAEEIKISGEFSILCQ